MLWMLSVALLTSILGSAENILVEGIHDEIPPNAACLQCLNNATPRKSKEIQLVLPCLWNCNRMKEKPSSTFRIAHFAFCIHPIYRSCIDIEVRVFQVR